MKKETLRFENIEVAEVWQPSVQLRFVNRVVDDFNTQLVGGNCLKNNIKILQQLFTSNLGNREGKDVPSEIE